MLNEKMEQNELWPTDITKASEQLVLFHDFSKIGTAHFLNSHRKFN
jgi:hypothetical protein